MTLTNTAIRNAKFAQKPYKLSDSKGLYLLISKTGKYWRFDYRYTGKRKTLALGIYPTISLANARNRLDDARKLLANDTDASLLKSVNKKIKQQATKNTFEAITHEWYTKKLPTWAPTTAKKVIRLMEKDIYPWLGKRSIKDIAAPELLAVLRRIENRGAFELAHRMKEYCGMVFRYAVATGRAERDPSSDLKGALSPAKIRHHPSITEVLSH